MQKTETGGKKGFQSNMLCNITYSDKISSPSDFNKTSSTKNILLFFQCIYNKTVGYQHSYISYCLAYKRALFRRLFRIPRFLHCKSDWE